MMKQVLLAGVALAASALGWSEATAQPSFCTGITMPVGSGGTVTGAFLLTGTASSGNCVEAGDKIFGGFSVGGAITGAGAASFSFSMTPGNVTEGFLGTPIGPNTTGFVDYSVAVDPALSQGFLIENLEKDFTFNAVNLTLPASATLTGTTTADPTFMFNCTRTSTPTGGTSTCPQTDVFPFTSQMTVNQTIAAGANATVTALTDTVSQASAVPEPASLALLGSALAGLWWALRRGVPKALET